MSSRKRLNKFLAVLMLVGLGLCIAAIVAVASPPSKESYPFSFSKGGLRVHEKCVIILNQSDNIYADFTATDSVNVLLLTPDNYTQWLALKDFTYEESVSRSSGEFESDSLAAGTYYLVIEYQGTATASGSVSYWYESQATSKTNLALTLFLMAMGIIAIGIIAFILQGGKVKFVDSAGRPV